MTETVTLALAACVVIVLVLLLSCWDGKKAKPERDDGTSASPKRRPPTTDPCTKPSEWGTGVENTKFRNRYQDLTDLSGYDDYNAVSQYMSVEPEVYESHARYSDDMGRSTSGASLLPVRDDPNDVVPWVGLRKPKYHEAYCAPGARQEHSDIPDQMRGASFYCVG